MFLLFFVCTSLRVSLVPFPCFRFITCYVQLINYLWPQWPTHASLHCHTVPQFVGLCGSEVRHAWAIAERARAIFATVELL